MIISRTPFRVSLFGGTTDYPEFYSKFESLLIGFAIDKYSYLSGRITPSILPYDSRFSYSSNEIIEKCANCNIQDYLDKIQHNGIRGVLQSINFYDPLEISHFCDIPSQTGLGSSSAFVVGLINLLEQIRSKNTTNEYVNNKKKLATEAIKVEREVLKEPGGIQDQIWAAYGGINSIHIDKSGDFKVKPLPVSEEFKRQLIECSCLIYTGGQRNSFELAAHTKSSTSIRKKILQLSYTAYEKFIDEDLISVANLLRVSWEEKKKIKSSISNSSVDNLYNRLLDSCMIGGKLLGAGGSGFIFAIFPDSSYIKELDLDIRANILEFKIDNEGSKIIYD